MAINKSLKYFLILGILLLSIGCASNVDSTRTEGNMPATIAGRMEVKSVPVPVIEDGWGVNPRELANAKDVKSLSESNWYTKKYSGKASSRAIELKSPSYMESSCKLAVKKENSKPLIESSYSSLGVDLKPEAISLLSAKITKEDLKNIEVNNCIPTSPEKTFSECECSLSYKVEGGKKAILDKVNLLK
jgi:hypothetical protein